MKHKSHLLNSRDFGRLLMEGSFLPTDLLMPSSGFCPAFHSDRDREHVCQQKTLQTMEIADQYKKV